MSVWSAPSTPRRAVVAGVLAALAGVAGCGNEPRPPAQPTTGPTSSTTAAAPGRPVTVVLGERPFTLYVPSSYRAGTAVPLVVLLHGYTASGAQQESYLKIAPEADKRGFLYATPDGTADAEGNRFWNATDACCNFSGSTVDDSRYLVDLIKAVSATYSVDARRVYLIGHSNGAFMSFRMACEHADLIAGIAALNGAMWSDLTRCAPSRPVSVLNIRGTNDATVNYAGGDILGNSYPSTEVTVRDWVSLDGCLPAPDTSPPPLDLTTDGSGAETSVTRYVGCQGNSVVVLWTINGGAHIPPFTGNFVPETIDFLFKQSIG